MPPPYLPGIIGRSDDGASDRAAIAKGPHDPPGARQGARQTASAVRTAEPDIPTGATPHIHAAAHVDDDQLMSGPPGEGDYGIAAMPRAI